MSEPKPVLIYDGHCGFCRIWLDYWRQLTGDRIEYLASQDVGARFPQAVQKRGHGARVLEGVITLPSAAGDLIPAALCCH